MSDVVMDIMPEACQIHDQNIRDDGNGSLTSSTYANHMGNIAGADLASDDDDAKNAEEAADEFENILSLKLKKPKHWKWELTTSRSCSNIAIPRILLYDHKGRLLVDVNTQEEQVFGDTFEKSLEKPRNRRQRRQRSKVKAATASLLHSINQALNQDFDGLHIQEASPSLLSPTQSTLYTGNSSPGVASTSCIDFFSNDLPDYPIERRSSSLKNVHFIEEIPGQSKTSTRTTNSFQIGDLPAPPPSSGTTPTTTASSSSGPREKRRYRRSQSSGRSGGSVGPINSPSILERLSFNKGRFSSPEHAVESDVYRPPRYFLRTSKAGTLVVQQESFSRYRRRCRPKMKYKYSSNENILNDEIERSHSVCSSKLDGNKSFQEMLLEQEQHVYSNSSASLEDVSAKRKHRRKKSLSTRQSNLSTSDDEPYKSDSRENELNFIHHHPRFQRRYSNLKRHLKGDLVTIHPENGVVNPYGSPTER